MGEITILLSFLGTLFFFFLLGFPVAYGLGLSSVVLMLMGFGGGLRYETMALRIYDGLNSFTLLAIPFFLVAGRVMNVGALTDRIFDFASSIVGGLKGGLGHVNVVASMIFAGMSGLATADAAGLGTIEYKAMSEGGYPDHLALGIAGASATIGAIFPPSVPTVLYAIVGRLSVGRILLGGILPGILIGIVLMIMVSVQAHIGDLPVGQPFSFSRVAKNFRKGFLALLTPVILIGGIMGGYFTPTEAAAVTVLYALILTVFVYRVFTISGFWDLIKETATDSFIITILIGMATIYGFMVTHSRIPIIFTEQVLALTENPILIMIILNIVLLILGMFLETFAIITILTPVLIPLINQVGIDPIHFGITMIFNLQIGLLTPPFGIVLFVLNKSTNQPYEKVLKGVLVYYIPLIICLIIIAAFPQLTLWIPNTFL